MRSGYAGVENPLFFDPKTQLLFGDAKASITEIAAELKPLLTAHEQPDGIRVVA
jgi:NAD(P) transhydrogenase subunit beta